MNDECVRHECTVALLLIDVINDLEFEQGKELLESAKPMADNLTQLKFEAKKRGIPCLYVNDNFGQWQSDFKHLVEGCITDGGARRLDSPRACSSTRRLLHPQAQAFWFFPNPPGYPASEPEGNEIDSLWSYNQFVRFIYRQ